jgi:hypothetical protein
MTEPEWKQYERQIFRLLKKKAKNARVEADKYLPGHWSKVARQIDIVVYGRFPGFDRGMTLIVDCKCFGSKVDVGDVDKFLGLVDDVCAPMGLMITNAGYTQAAKDRATGHPAVSLDVVELDQLAFWEAHVPSISHTSGTNWALLSATVDGKMVTQVVDLDVANRILEKRGSDWRVG